MSTTLTPPPESEPKTTVPRRLLGEVSTLEWVVAAVVAAVMLILVLLEPGILEAPFENASSLLFTFGGTAVAVVALVAMLWFRVPPIVRILVLGIPFLIVNWWLLSPSFIDDVVDDQFETSIAAERDSAGAIESEAESDAAVSPTSPAVGEAPAEEPIPGSEPAAGPVLLGSGSFRGLAGHSGTGDAGIFSQPDGSYLLRFENFDIENGPDLKIYLVPGADQTSPADGSINLGALRGNVGDQSYELPSGTDLPTGAYTALVWCEAFSVEFVGATISIA